MNVSSDAFIIGTRVPLSITAVWVCELRQQTCIWHKIFANYLESFRAIIHRISGPLHNMHVEMRTLRLCYMITCWIIQVRWKPVTVIIVQSSFIVHFLCHFMSNLIVIQSGWWFFDMVLCLFLHTGSGKLSKWHCHFGNIANRHSYGMELLRFRFGLHIMSHAFIHFVDPKRFSNTDSALRDQKILFTSL